MTDRKTFNVLRQWMEQTTNAFMEFTVANRASMINCTKTPFRANFMLPRKKIVDPLWALSACRGRGGHLTLFHHKKQITEDAQLFTFQSSATPRQFSCKQHCRSVNLHRFVWSPANTQNGSNRVIEVVARVGMNG